MNIDAAALSQSIDEAAGKVADPAVARRTPVHIAEAPFYAIPLVAGVSFTMGGIAINGDGEVLDSKGNIIQGLFAAGGAAGGLHGGPNAGYAGGLLESAVFGMLAGTAASANCAE